ncbi:MAG: methyltransferase domain-containing protein [Deltaproteobacteria bacterium]|nr:methyltransferase domain-containing protein [Deltaproteobacteria bacterium]
MPSSDPWNPEQYERFRSERAQPFHDLIALIRARPGMRVIDLGCGTGELTAALATRLAESTILGIDRSEAMLERAAARTSERVRFARAEVASVQDFSGYDLVLSNATLHWVPDNEALMHRILTTLPSGGQLAIQVPRNDGHVSHRTADALARESPWAEKLGGFVHVNQSLSAEVYSSLLCEHGCHERVVCMEKIYAHDLARSEDVVEWLKGTLLTAYVSRLDPQDAEAFLAAYQQRLMIALGDHRPYHYTYRRMLLWAQKG